jgi:hypothetical protein
MPELHHILTTEREGRAAVYQGAQVQPRRLTLMLEQRRGMFLEKRDALLEVLNPDLVTADSPAWLRYTGVDATLELPVVYVGGLEDVMQETLELKLLALYPIWRTVDEVSTALPLRSSLASADYVLVRSSGVWSEVMGGSAGESGIGALLLASDGVLYIGGDTSVFTWDGTTLTDLSLAGGCTCLAEGPDGTVYAGGAFGTSYVQAWDGAAWSAVGAMGSPLPYALVVGPDGTVYAGGLDMGVSGETVKWWNGSSWLALGTGSDVIGGLVRALLIDGVGDLLAGGAFAGGVKFWTGAAWITLGDGLAAWPSGDPEVYDLALGLDGVVYAAGDFEQADNAYVGYIAQWSGVAWLSLGVGTNGVIRAMRVAEDGTLIVGGDFVLAGGLSMSDKLAQWNGYSWFPLDVKRAVQANITALTGGDDLYVGYSGETSAVVAQVGTVANLGTAAAWPVLTITAPAGSSTRVYQLVNLTSGEVIYFNMTLQPGEVLTVDLRPGVKSVSSSFRGNLLRGVVPGSNLATWRLLPGDNRVSLFVDAAGSADLAWLEWFWGVESAG